MSNQLKVACYNRQVKDLDMIFQTIKGLKADLILFPEAFFEASIIDDKFWLEKAITYDKAFVVGVKGKNRITQKVYLPKGKILKYHKIHIGTIEKEKYIPGEEILVFNYKAFNIGIMICSDTHFNDLFIIHRKSGAELILAPFKSPHKPVKRKKLWQKFLPTRAYDYRLSIVANNYTDDKYGGHAAYNPYGEKIKSMQEDFLPIYSIEKFREKGSMQTIDFFKKRKEEVYKKYLL